ncbi:hypothetical protein [Nitrosomonas communis]|uniref:Uncharacterized protein n=1 Tax=Nitrosomonas communis TaxID=44574 RepID=A0A1I4QS86_9PROT|nr:hypothetical protein SAMN05421863_102832 [Nitrosomonas communis]
MPRLMVSDQFRSKREKILLQEVIYNKHNLRIIAEGVLTARGLVAHGVTYLRILEIGMISTKHSMPRCKWIRIFQALIIDPDREWKFIDGSNAKHTSISTEAIDQESAGHIAGNSSKIHLRAENYSLPVQINEEGSWSCDIEKRNYGKRQRRHGLK